MIQDLAQRGSKWERTRDSGHQMNGPLEAHTIMIRSAKKWAEELDNRNARMAQA